MAEFLVTFAAGAGYGVTNVLVGQPLDTIKTRMQGLPSASQQSSINVARTLLAKEGIRGLYRGGLPLFVGGSFMRSAQFGVSGRVKHLLQEQSNLPKYKLFGFVDYQVLLAGAAGGIGRGVIEIPTDYFKTRRQVEQSWSIRSVLDGTGVTLLRNTVLFAAFAVYLDLSKQVCATGKVPRVLTTEDGRSLAPFWKGAICANMAWLTCWPFDVIKTQRQSGYYDACGTSSWKLLRDNVASGRLFRGVVPGLVRSSIANGSSMVVYEYVQTTLSQRFGLERKDIV